MDETERAIADSIKENTGLNTSISILEETELTPRGLIYSDFFAFSHDAGDKTVYYTVAPDSSIANQQQIKVQQPAQQDQEERSAYFASLNQDFTIPLAYYFTGKKSELPAPNFELAKFLHQCPLNNLTQPPDLT